MATDEGTGTVSTKPPALSVEFVMTALALIAQGMMTVELFEPGTIAGKLVGILGLVLTGLGYSVARVKAVKAALPSALYVALFVLFAAQLAIGCTPGQRAGAGRVAAGFVDCMTPSAKEATGQLLPAFADVIRNATSGDGSVDKDRIKAVGKSLLAPTMQCAFATAIAEAVRPRATAAGAPQSAELVPNAAELRGAFEDLRGEWGGATYKLESGAL